MHLAIVGRPTGNKIQFSMHPRNFDFDKTVVRMSVNRLSCERMSHLLTI